MAKAKISMKLLVDKSKRKVLFAEAGKECVDFFLHILSLPLGSVVGFLTKESMAGSVGALYGSLENLGADYLQEDLIKDSLLNPKPALGSSSNVPLLAIDHSPDDFSSRILYTCVSQNHGTYYNNAHPYVSFSSAAKCPQCKKQMTEKLTGVPSPLVVEKAPAGDVGGGGYVKGVVTYMIMDDLTIEPMSTISGIALLNKFNVQDVGRLEEKVFSLDMKQSVALLRASLVSKTVLTDVFFGKKA